MEINILQYIRDNIPELSERLFPVVTTDISRLSVVYQFTDISGGHLNHSQLSLKVIWADYDECMRVHEKLRSVLAMEEDAPFKVAKDTRFHTELSAGGGTMFNDELQMWEITKYYQIDWRKI